MRYIILCLLLAAAPAKAQPVPLAELIIRSAKPRLPETASELRVRDLKSPRDVPKRLDPDAATLSFRAQEDFSGPTLIRLEHAGRSRWLTVDFELWVPTAVARSDLARGHVLNPDDLVMKALPRRLHGGSGPPSPDSLIGRVLLENVLAGQPLLSGRLRRPVVINRGDRVEVVVAGVNLWVRSTGVAQAAGRVGDSIPVKCRSSSKRLVGVVAGKGRVRITLRKGVLP